MIAPEWLLKIWDGTLHDAILILFVSFLAWRVTRVERRIGQLVDKDQLNGVEKANQQEHQLMQRAQELADASLQAQIANLRPN